MPYKKFKNRLSEWIQLFLSTGEYKVVRISRLGKESDIIQAEIHALGSGNGGET